MAGTQRMTKVVLDDLLAKKGLAIDPEGALAASVDDPAHDEERSSGERSVPPVSAAPRFEEVYVPDVLVPAEETFPEDHVPAIAQELPPEPTPDADPIAAFDGFGETDDEEAAKPEPTATDAQATRRLQKITTPSEPTASVIIDETVTLAAAVAAHNARVTAAKAEAKAKAAPARAPSPSSPDALKTKLARKFTSFADDLNERLVDFRIGAAWWSVELTAPEGMSTAGGKQALQHLRLRPRRSGFTDFVGGSVDAGGKYAELRDYEYVCMVHALRFANQRLALTEPEWEQLLRRVEVELASMDVATHRVGPPKEVRAERAKQRRIPPAAIAAFAVITLLALVVVWRVIAAL